MSSIGLLFSDWHVHNYSQFNNGTDRLESCLRVLPELGLYCRKAGITKVLFGGDLYDTQKALLTVVVNRTVEVFLAFEQEFPEIEIIAISGNHDYATKNTMKNPAVTALDHIERICNNFSVIDNSHVIRGNAVIHGIPYYEYKEDFQEALKKAAESAELINSMADGDPRVHHLMIHQTPIMDNSVIPYDTTFKDPLYEVFDRIWCGHIHSQLDISEKFTLIGNPIHRDLGDKGKKKGFLLTNLEKPEKGYIFKHLSGYPEFIEIEEGEPVPEGHELDYVIRRPNKDMDEMMTLAKVDDFNTSLTPTELITNFWQEQGGSDEKLLVTGLAFLQL